MNIKFHAALGLGFRTHKLFANLAWIVTIVVIRRLDQRMAVSILVKQCSVPSYVAYYGHLENRKSSPPTVLCESTYSILKFSGILQLKKVGATCNKPRLDSHLGSKQNPNEPYYGLIQFMIPAI